MRAPHCYPLPTGDVLCSLGPQSVASVKRADAARLVPLSLVAACKKSKADLQQTVQQVEAEALPSLQGWALIDPVHEELARAHSTMQTMAKAIAHAELSVATLAIHTALGR